MQERRFGAFSSSVNPQELSKSVEGFMKMGAGLLVFMGVLTQADGNNLIEQVVIIVPLAFSAWNAGEMIFGLLRKAFVAFVAKF